MPHLREKSRQDVPLDAVLNDAQTETAARGPGMVSGLHEHGMTARYLIWQFGSIWRRRSRPAAEIEVCCANGKSSPIER
jgi:hypothetical protein